jgi:hypothetical protein
LRVAFWEERREVRWALSMEIESVMRVREALSGVMWKEDVQLWMSCCALVWMLQQDHAGSYIIWRLVEKHFDGI